jgi:hypothetical protein
MAVYFFGLETLECSGPRSNKRQPQGSAGLETKIHRSDGKRNDAMRQRKVLAFWGTAVLAVLLAATELLAQSNPLFVPLQNNVTGAL